MYRTIFIYLIEALEPCVSTTRKVTWLEARRYARIKRKEGEVHLIASRLRRQVKELTQFGLIGHFVEQIDEVDVVGVRAEMMA